MIPIFYKENFKMVKSKIYAKRDEQWRTSNCKLRELKEYVSPWPVVGLGTGTRHFLLSKNVCYQKISRENWWQNLCYQKELASRRGRRWNDDKIFYGKTRVSWRVRWNCYSLYGFWFSEGILREYVYGFQFIVFNFGMEFYENFSEVTSWTPFFMFDV